MARTGGRGESRLGRRGEAWLDGVRRGGLGRARHGEFTRSGLGASGDLTPPRVAQVVEITKSFEPIRTGAS